MTTLTTKLYEVITDYQGDTLANYIGVVEGGSVSYTHLTLPTKRIV